jgi:dihydrofolate reductase
MRRIVAAEYLSLDGVTEDPGPAGEYEHRGWTVPYWNDDMPKLVASTTLREPLEWHSTLLEGDVVDAVASLKQQTGEDILIYGSGALVNTLLPHNLIDEYRFMIYPLVLGSGKRFFRDDNDKTTLTLKQTETASTGVTMLVCEPAP